MTSSFYLNRILRFTSRRHGNLFLAYRTPLLDKTTTKINGAPLTSRHLTTPNPNRDPDALDPKVFYLLPVVASGVVGLSAIAWVLLAGDEDSGKSKKSGSSVSSSSASSADRPHRQRPREEVDYDSGISAAVRPFSSNPTYGGGSTGSNLDINVRENRSDRFDAESAIKSVGEQVSPSELRRRYEYRTTTTGRKRHLQVIGKGAYGRVVSARSRNTGMDVAMKVVSNKSMSAEALLREVEVLRRVRGHDNIIHLLEVLECEGEWYLVTELCEGGDLLDRLIANGPFDEETASRVIANAASALNHVHRTGYAHCDVKPENLVFVTKGKTRRDPNANDVRLIDFGMAKDLASVEKLGGFMLSTTSSSHALGGGSRVGTIAYWSPEQVEVGIAPQAMKGDNNNNNNDDDESTVASNASASVVRRFRSNVMLRSDPRACDAWALGVVLYIMLFGCHPFDVKGSGDEVRIARDIIKGEVRFDVHGERVRTSHAVRDVITRLLEPDPNKRMTVRELLQHPWILKYNANASSEDEGDAVEGNAREEEEEEEEADGGNDSKLHSTREINGATSGNGAVINISPEQRRKHELRLRRLPTSWKESGYLPTVTTSDAVVEALPGTPDHARIAPFKDKNQLFIQSVVLAAVALAKQEHGGGSGETATTTTTEEEIHAPSSSSSFSSSSTRAPLLEAAFKILDVEGSGYVTERGLKELAHALGRSATSGDALNSAMERASSGYATTPSTPPPKIPHITFSEFESLLKRQQCVSRNFQPGQVVFEQGALPQGVYLLDSGSARVEWTPPIRGEKVVTAVEYATIPSVSVIGETAIVQGRTQRSATIRVLEPSRVVFIPKFDFLEAVAESRSLHELLFGLANEQQAARIYQLVERLSPSLYEVKRFSPGEVLFKQGEPANVLYLVKEGLVDVSVRGATTGGGGAMHVSVGKTRKGNVVGISAVDGGKRNTTATCVTEVTAIAISHTALQKLLRDFPILRFYIEGQKRWRNENWQSVLSDMEQGVSEPQLLPMMGEGIEEDAGTSFEAYQRALAAAPLRSYVAGEYIFRKGERSGELFVLESGRADVELTGPDGTRMTIAQLGPGDHIGEQALLDGRPQFAFSVRCVAPCEVRAINEASFFKLMGDNGSSSFARAVRVAMRQRRHRWVKNLLGLARADKCEIQRIELEPGDALFRLGEPIERLYFVKRGGIAVTKPDGTNVRNLTAGDTIGWEVFREGGAVSSATATCVFPGTIVSALGKETLGELIKAHRYVSPQLEKSAESSNTRTGQGPLNRKKSVLHQQQQHSHVPPQHAATH